MPGNGTIGGGRSCSLNFKIGSGKTRTVLSTTGSAGKHCKIKVSFPQDPEHEPITVDLKKGPCVKINWR